jgi:2-dehydropantoate 2-reductase
MLFGPVGNGVAAPLAPLQDLLAACEGAGFEAVLSDKIETEIWAKFMRLAVISGMTAVTRCPLGVVVNDPDLAAMMVDALHESFAVADACGVPLDPSVIPAIMKANQSIPGEMKSSMLEDLERGRPLELPFLSGTVVRLGEERGIPTPVHRFITTVLKPFVNGAR